MFRQWGVMERELACRVNRVNQPGACYVQANCSPGCFAIGPINPEVARLFTIHPEEQPQGARSTSLGGRLLFGGRLLAPSALGRAEPILVPGREGPRGRLTARDAVEAPNLAACSTLSDQCIEVGATVGPKPLATLTQPGGLAAGGLTLCQVALPLLVTPPSAERPG